MKTLSLVLVSLTLSGSAAVLGGCAVHTTSAPADMCTERSGNYTAQYFEHPGGTCGPMSTVTFGIDPSLPDVAPSCTGLHTPSADNCDETFDLTCPTGTSAGGTLQSIGTTSWTRDASQGSSVFRYIYRDDAGNVTCDSTYTIVYTRSN